MVYNDIRQAKIDTIGIFNIPNKTPKTNVVLLPVNSEDIEVYGETISYKVIQELYEKKL